MTVDGIKPQQKEESVKISYWVCNVLGHRHRSEKSAKACIMKRKGESGELKKLRRNLSMLEQLMAGEPLVKIARTHYCSDSNITKAVASSLEKARILATEGGGSPYPFRLWKRSDFTDQDLKGELEFLIRILRQREVVLSKLVVSKLVD